jgi:hypothetical protein
LYWGLKKGLGICLAEIGKVGDGHPGITGGTGREGCDSEQRREDTFHD